MSSGGEQERERCASPAAWSGWHDAGDTYRIDCSSTRASASRTSAASAARRTSS